MAAILKGNNLCSFWQQIHSKEFWNLAVIQRFLLVKIRCLKETKFYNFLNEVLGYDQSKMIWLRPLGKVSVVKLFHGVEWSGWPHTQILYSQEGLVFCWRFPSLR